MLNEAPRGPDSIPLSVPVNPEIQQTLDKVNRVLKSSGYALQPITKIKNDTPRLARYFIEKYAKYLVSSFVLRAVPKPPVAAKPKRKKKRKKR